MLLVLGVLAGCESDEQQLARLRADAGTSCRGLQDMRAQFDSAFGYWMTMNPDTLMPIAAAYGDSLKVWYDQCESAVQRYNRFRREAGAPSEDMTMPAPP